MRRAITIGSIALFATGVAGAEPQKGGSVPGLVNPLKAAPATTAQPPAPPPSPVVGLSIWVTAPNSVSTYLRDFNLQGDQLRYVVSTFLPANVAVNRRGVPGAPVMGVFTPAPTTAMPIQFVMSNVSKRPEILQLLLHCFSEKKASFRVRFMFDTATAPMLPGIEQGGSQIPQIDLTDVSMIGCQL